jgi:hypothetical protein
MPKIAKILCALVVVLALYACGKGPGPLEGTWRMAGPLPVTVIFRKDETETLGVIQKVSYERKGDDVVVTYESGLLKGTSVRYTMNDRNTAAFALGTLKRVD